MEAGVLALGWGSGTTDWQTAKSWGTPLQDLRSEPSVSCDLSSQAEAGVLRVPTYGYFVSEPSTS